MSEHKLIFRAVANGAGLGECACGWKSRVADDGHPEYTKADIKRDYERHVADQAPGLYRVMICDQFEDIRSANEEEAKAEIEKRVKAGTIALNLIAWEI